MQLGFVMVLNISADGPLLGSGRDASDIIGDALGADAELVVIPVERLEPAFFQLRSGLLGEFVQKFTNFGLRLAFVGDLGDQIAQSKSLHDFVFECGKNDRIQFVADINDVR